ncbi:MAG: hypothetical protein RIR51_706 [Bacteroidota bacterium]|jgi:hypothetical protein
MKNLNKIVGIFFALIFLLFAYWQLNDIDPYLWVSIYLISVYSGIRVYLGKYNPELYLVIIFISFVAGYQTWTEMTSFDGFNYEDLSMKSHNQELAREAVGLWILSFSYLVYYLVSKIQKNA